MSETEILYGYSSIAIAFSLFIAMAFCNEIGFKAGRFVQKNTDDEIKALTGSIQGSILGLLALLLGFTFSMSMQRYDNRNMALINEVNDISTALRRVQLLPVEYKQESMALLKEYITVRVAIGKADLTKATERKRYNKEIDRLQNELWSLAIASTAVDQRAVTTGAFINSLNKVIDSQGKRNALLQMHVPEVVLLLLFIVFISSGTIMGYSSGLTGKRVMPPLLLVSLLITLIVFIIIDLDRPKRGVIQVDQTAMIELLTDAQELLNSIR